MFSGLSALKTGRFASKNTLEVIVAAGIMSAGFASLAYAALRRYAINDRLDHTSSDDPYRILGAKRTLSNDELKTLYRRCVSQVHPDRAIASGQSPDALRKASERLILLNAAWKRIKNERGIV